MKNESKHKFTKIGPIDSFYETSYTSNTVTEIKEWYEYLDFACKCCKVNRTNTKMAVKDTYYPTFVIMRKQFCHQCWLHKIIY